MKHLHGFCILAVMLLTAATPLRSQTQADDIIGTYTVPSPFNDDVARVQITRATDGTYRGRIVWANHSTNADGTVRRDEKNADPKLRSRRFDEIYMAWNLRFKDGEWVDGKLYDPYTGKTFSIKFKPIKNSRNLKARYYKGVTAIGIDGTWVRYPSGAK